MGLAWPQWKIPEESKQSRVMNAAMCLGENHLAAAVRRGWRLVYKKNRLCESSRQDTMSPEPRTLPEKRSREFFGGSVKATEPRDGVCADEGRWKGNLQGCGESCLRHHLLEAKQLIHKRRMLIEWTSVKRKCQPRWRNTAKASTHNRREIQAALVRCSWKWSLTTLKDSDRGKQMVATVSSVTWQAG